MKIKSVIGKVAVMGAMLCLLITFVMPSVVNAAPSGTVTNTGTGACQNLSNTGLKGVVNCIVEVLSAVVGLLIAGAVVFVLYGAFQMIQSEEKRDEGKQKIYHGIIGLFVMVSVWGLVRILQSTFNLTNTPITPPEFTPQGAGAEAGLPGFDGNYN